jgi:hypothetical protein
MTTNTKTTGTNNRLTAAALAIAITFASMVAPAYVTNVQAAPAPAAVMPLA